ncbi:MAG: hypothetical protein KGZ41_06915 [Dethiobacter sp.]|nr:hypothetical protein [Dethiobacter sp.]MBS3900279.1 hypothetical protein [Dethiobacter sp.]MBS3983516.1 hypothetical protein [Dethiobacter sp.]MCL4463409.1 hypothetical protein [Bacillota bacterium]MCL5992876.1 hypothetical protein [Bacillota bacterium]
MEREVFVAIIRENLEDGRLYCAKAFELAAAHGFKLWQVGQICEEEKIKIKGCQLGCF